MTWRVTMKAYRMTREYVIDANPEDQKALRDAGAAFWESLQSGDEPPIDCSDHTLNAVRDLHPDIDPETTVELGADYAHYIRSKGQADLAAEEARLYKSLVLAVMGTARVGTYNETPVLRRQPGRNGSVSLYPVKESA